MTTEFDEDDGYDKCHCEWGKSDAKVSVMYAVYESNMNV